MTLREYQLSCKEFASMLGEYELMTKTELANGYCDADEASKKALAEGNVAESEGQELLRSAYYSALMLRYWYKIFEWIRNSSSLNLEPVEFAGWLSKGLYVAFYYRVWRWEYEAVVKEGDFIEWKLDENGNKIPNRYYYKKDPNAPDKIINRCCGSIRGRAYQYMNKDKRKSDTQTFSLDQMVEDVGDSALAYGKCYETPHSMDGISLLINEFINRGEHFEAFIVDGIANYDTQKVTQVDFINSRYNPETQQEEEFEDKRPVSMFDKRKLIKHLNSLDEHVVSRFCMNYNLTPERAFKVVEKIKATPNAKLYKLVEKTLQEIRSDKSYLEFKTEAGDM